VIPPKNLTELDRLGIVVRAIDHECFIVPEGGFRLTPDHELVRNKCFEGINKEDIMDLGFYKHFRNVQDYEKKERLDKGDAVFRYDLLDEI